jgi:hypothetical protein
MTTIATALPTTYSPPTNTAVTPPAAAAPVATAATNNNEQDAQPTADKAPATDTNATANAPAIYTAQAGASTSNIRGTTVNTTA